MGNLDSLPAEIILDIFKCLDIDSVIRYRLVSRSWNYPIYHRVLDYLKETQVELESWRLKRLKSGPNEETTEFVKQGIINAQKNSGGQQDGLFEFQKLIHLKIITEQKLQEEKVLWYLQRSREQMKKNGAITYVTA